MSVDIVPENPRLWLRAAQPDDNGFLRQLFHKTRVEELAATGLSGPLLDQLIAHQFRGQSASYAAQFPNAASLIVIHDAIPAGRLLLNCTREHWHIIDIALLPTSSGRGLGSDIIEATARAARDQGAPKLSLSVLSTNTNARRLYLRLGFAEVRDGVHIEMVKPLAG